MNRHLTRRELLAAGGATVAVMTGCGLMGRMLPALQTQSAPHTPSRFPLGYFHGLFLVERPDEVELAARLGITHTICYGHTSIDSADPSTALGQALARHGMKTLLNMIDFLHAEDGRVQLDVAGAAALVGRLHNSPLLAGYWTKDDDLGDERAAVVQLHRLIRAVDPNPAHLVVPGFGDADSVQRNYAPGQADVLGFYPYPAYSRGPAIEVPAMLRVVDERTNVDAVPPPFVGIYQAYSNPNHGSIPDVNAVLEQAQLFLSFGAIGLIGFSMETGTEAFAVINDATLREAVSQVSQMLRQEVGQA